MSEKVGFFPAKIHFSTKTKNVSFELLRPCRLVVAALPAGDPTGLGKRHFYCSVRVKWIDLMSVIDVLCTFNCVY